jgi:DNA-binding protein HU-beta
MNKSDLIDAVAEKTDVAKADVSRVLEALFGKAGVLGNELRKGGKVQISGFGSFQVRKRPARAGTDPRTGHAIQIRAAVVPVFRPGQGLKETLNRKR